MVLLALVVVVVVVVRARPASVTEMFEAIPNPARMVLT